MTAAESTSPMPDAPGVGVKYSRNITSVWTSRMSTKFAWIPSARSATYPARSLLAWDTAERTVDQKMASHPRGLLKATTLAWASSMPCRSRSSRSATRVLRRPMASAARWMRSRTSLGAKITSAMRTPIARTMVRLPRKRS